MAFQLSPTAITKFCTEVIARMPLLGVSKTGNLTSGGRWVSPGRIFSEIETTLGQALVVEIAETLGEGMKTYPALRDEQTGRQIVAEFLVLLQAKALASQEAPVDLGAAYYPGIRHPLSELEYVFNQTHPSKSFLRHPATGVVYDIASELVEGTLERILGKAYGEFLTQRSCQRLIRYVPFKGAHLTDPARPDQPIYNAWTPAEWDQDWAARDFQPTACPEIFSRFLNHLFPTDEGRRAAEAWHRDVCFGKAGCALVLSGASGSGKTTYLDIAKFLVGPKNHTRAPRKFFEGRFQGLIATHRLLVCDELRVTAEIRDTIKDFLEPEGVFDEKYELIREIKKMPCSVAVASNYAHGISLEYDDRKFSVPDLATVDLKKVWSPEEIAALLAAIQDPATLKEYAAYLFYTYSPGQCMEIPRGAKFERLCLNSLDKRFRVVLDEWAKGSPMIKSTKINRGVTSATAWITTDVKEQLEAYRQSRGVEIGYLKDDSVGANWTLIFKNQPALPKAVDDEETL